MQSKDNTVMPDEVVETILLDETILITKAAPNSSRPMDSPSRVSIHFIALISNNMMPSVMVSPARPWQDPLVPLSHFSLGSGPIGRPEFSLVSVVLTKDSVHILTHIGVVIVFHFSSLCFLSSLAGLFGFSGCFSFPLCLLLCLFLGFSSLSGNLFSLLFGVGNPLVSVFLCLFGSFFGFLDLASGFFFRLLTSTLDLFIRLLLSLSSLLTFFSLLLPECILLSSMLLAGCLILLPTFGVLFVSRLLIRCELSHICLAIGGESFTLFLGLLRSLDRAGIYLLCLVLC